MFKQYFFLIIILLLGATIRLYKIDSIPNGLYQDETAIGYNAYSILKTGRDEHGQLFPLYFKSFGDYKLPVYVYLTVISVNFFGLTPFAVRLPSVLFGILAIISIYFFIKTIYEVSYPKSRPEVGNVIALLTSAFLAISPWHIHYSRAAFEVSVALVFFLSGTMAIYKGLYGKRTGFFLLGTLLFILAFYTYNLTRLLSPLLYIIVLFVNIKSFNNISKKEIIFSGLFSILLLTPAFLTLFSKGGVNSAGGTLIFSSATVLAPLLELRGIISQTSPFFAKLFFNTPVSIFFQYIKNILAYTSVKFFFLEGSSHGNHGIGNMGLFYIYEFPLLIYGLFHMICNRNNLNKLMLLWLTTVILTCAMTRESPHATRSFFLLPPAILAITYGFIELFRLIKKTGKLFKYVFLMIFSGLILYNWIYYISSYFIRFPVVYAKNWRSADRELGNYLSINDKNFKSILVDPQAGLIYSSVLFYTKFDPAEFQKTAKWSRDDEEGFSYPISFDKFIYKNIDWKNDITKKNTLIITSSNILPSGISPKIIFAYPVYTKFLSIKEKLNFIPNEQTAYITVQGIN